MPLTSVCVCTICVHVHTHIRTQDTGEYLGIGGVEDKFHELLMYIGTNEMNVRGVQEAGTHFCGITKGYRALRTNTTLLNQNAGYKIIYRVFSIYIVPSPVHF